MKKQIIMIIIGIFLINLVYAVNIQAGETYEIDLGIPYSYYEIVRNSTEVDVNVSLNGTVASITPNKYMNTGSFDIVFYAEEKEPIIEHHYSGGSGGTRTIYRDRNNTIYKNKTVYKDKIIEICSNETEIYDIDIIDKDTEPNWKAGLLIVLIGFIIFYVIWRLMNRKIKQNN